jgi:hypothetical protein
MTMSMKKMLARRSLILSIGILGSLFVSTSSSSAADCNKASDSKLPACVSATAKAGPGSSMQTIQQGGAEAQKIAAQGKVETRTAAAGQAGLAREKRTWIGQTAITCKKGSVTLHLQAGTAQCPDGFHKS